MNPQAFGKYQLIKKLATGGMAEVWLAKQTGIEGFKKEVVVKRILPHLADDPEFVQMFLNEAKIAARFGHPNIAQIFDFGLEQSSSTYFIAMEFIRGEDLGRVMRKAWSAGQWIARPLAVRMVASCCEGLYYAHSQADEQGRPLKVVHRDISPQNILISFDGSVKLVDFGIAKAADVASMTKSGAIKGKFAYMSPEQAAGKPLDHRSDIFAIGLVLYELLTGVRPLKRDSELMTLQAALECAIEPPSAVADVPRELDDVVMKALTKAADDRYRDARSFQMALEEFLVAQRWVATSVQISELMETLFADRIAEERRLGHANPPAHDSHVSMPAVPAMGGPTAPSAAYEGPGSGGKTSTSSGLKKDAPAPPPEEPRRNSLRDSPGPNGRAAVNRKSDGAGFASVDADATLPPPKASNRGSNPVRRKPTGAGSQRAADDDSYGDRKRSGAYSRSENFRRGQSAEMPEAPPRRESRGDEDALPPIKREQSRSMDSIDEQLEAQGNTERRRQSVYGIILLALALAVAGAAVAKRDVIIAMISKGAGADYYVSVDTTPQVQVYLVHQASEHQGTDPIALGPSPLVTTAAHPGDTLILENKQMALHTTLTVDNDLAAGDTMKVKREFKHGRVRLRIAPRSISDLHLFYEGMEVGTFPGPPVDLVEGAHALELRGSKLRKPVPVEVDVKANTTVDSKMFDLTAQVTD